MVFASHHLPKLPLPVTSPPFSPSDLATMKERVPEVAELLRFMATPSRLLLLCQLAQGEMTQKKWVP